MTNKSKFFAELKKQHNIKKFKVSSKNTKLAKTHKVMLAAFDEIDESLGHAEYLVLDAFTETMDKGDEAYMLGRDIMRFDFMDTRNDAISRIDEVKATLDELGVAYPPELEGALARLEELNTEENRSRDRFQKWETIY